MYLTNALHFADTTATPIYSAFKMACYFLPLAGGFIADRWLGRYWTIVGFSVPYVAGHFILGLPNHRAVHRISILAGGSGVIKPNISTLMGQTYNQNSRARNCCAVPHSCCSTWLLTSAADSTLAMPYLRDKFGYAVAFQFPAWLMVASLAVFALGKPHYALEIPEQKSDSPRNDAGNGGCWLGFSASLD